MPKRFHPAIIALLIQIASTATAGTLMSMVTVHASLFEWAILQGLLAGLLSFLAKSPVWWVPIHFLFMPLVIITLAFDISATWYLVMFLGLLLIYGKSFVTQVPLYLSSETVNQALETLLPKQNQFTFIDLGSGCGGLLKNLARIHGNGSFHGIESAPIPFVISKLRSLFDSDYDVHWGDFWKHDFSRYDVVYAYLSPVPMDSLWQKAKKEMRPGSLLISNTFVIPGVAPDKSIQLNDFSNSTLYLWRL
ncbi:class I SAM-dependent methyltransferase [Nitrosomonas sp.]|uniref:class I SAM-dependent methyltransferase n=1 Tax=Nitrosomonas sp. TaxID=42353 RepID=UPI001D60A5A7|nr:class I SAM-dependent methyltransferase [Nitrosomonas sp.]MBX3615996.1 class I SAM-dependent methyltransferase [Nitrosomonas sp.]